MYADVAASGNDTAECQLETIFMEKVINSVLVAVVLVSSFFTLIGIGFAIDPPSEPASAGRRALAMLAVGWIVNAGLGTLLAHRYSRELTFWLPICLIPGLGPIAILLAGDFYGRSPLIDFINNLRSLTSNKICSGCGKQVPIKSASGQRCPWCNAKWSD